MVEKQQKPPIRSQLYDRVNVSVKGINWFISGIVVLLVSVLVMAFIMR